MGQRSSAPPFDTQRAVEELVAAGMPPEQASVIVRLHLRWADRDFATGKDIDLLRENMELKFGVIEQRIDARYESLDHKIDARFAALETKIAQSATNTIKWAAGSQIGTAAIYLAALLAVIEL